MVSKLEEDPRRTFFRDIEQIPPGTAFEASLDGGFREWSFWSLDEIEQVPDPEAPERFFALFEDAVRLRLRSDVPVGVCLSGGLDSTAIICSMARQRAASGDDADDPLHAFSFIDPDFDESGYIHDTMAQTKARLHRLELAPRDIWTSTEEALRLHDEPFHSASALIGFELMRMARSAGIKVVLNGQGADESIGGYPPYFQHRWEGLLCSGRLGSLRRNITDYAEAHGADPRELFATLARRTLRTTLRKIPLYRETATRRQAAALRGHRWYRAEIIEGFEHDPRELDRISLHRSLIESVMGRLMRIYLRVEDRNSMAHSLEARLPFLDYRLVSYVCSLPDEWKVRGPWNKYVLRESMKGRIPEAVRNRVDKFGFPVPVDRWFRSDLQQPLQDLLSDRRTQERGLYDLDAIRTAVAKQKDENAAIGSMVYRLVLFELWMRMLDERPWSRRPPRAAERPPLAAAGPTS